jgi:WD40 repeat protein
MEVAEYSPDGAYLAVGSHDGNIYILDAGNGYSTVGVCKGHKAAITCLDWD